METINMTEHKKLEKKKEYHAPKLEVIGDVRTVTHGSILGTADFGAQTGPEGGVPSQPA